ncbi:MAG: trypsin-like peptidase domain-containing protein [Eubacteriales bacterium]|nr:trypsin-like peptidase domain-containing protein [Eubacteriales bacterium]
MNRKKRVGTSLAVIAAVAVLGVTAYGVGNKDAEEPQQEEQRIMLDSSADLDSATTLDTADAAATADKKIEEIPVQEDSSASLPNIQKVAEDVMPAIVAITNVGVEEIDFFGRSYTQDVESSGSGIIVAKSDDELLIATNNHVVEGAEELTVCFSVDMDNEEDEEKKLVSAQVKGTDSSLDLAVVAVKLEDIDEEVADKIGIVQLGDSDEVQVGEWVVAIGNALGYGQSVTTGIVSALDREVTVSTTNGTVTNNMIQTDAAINFGNSGGALLDMDGRLIGINSAKAAVEGVEGMGYAIPINTAKSVIEDLMNQTTRSKVDEDKAGALGVIVVDVSDEAKQIYNIPSGAFVNELTKDGAAQEAGIRQGDIITKLDQTTISSRSELLNRMQYYEAGETVVVTVKRAGDNGYEEKEIEVTLGKKSDLDDTTTSGSSRSRNNDDYDDYGNGNGEEYDDGYSDDGYDDGYQQYDSDDFSIGDLFRSFGF